MSSTLDLHGVKHADAEREVIAFMEKNYSTSGMYKIITGNSEKMKKIAYDVLYEYEIEMNKIQLLNSEITFNI